LTNSVEAARRFIDDAPIPRHKRRREVVARRSTQLDATNESVVTGSEVMSFVTGLSVERRQSLLNSSLLAQLVAKQKVPDANNIEEWYKAYFEVLTNIGWVVRETNFTEYNETSDTFETHKAILALATSLLGAAPAALALVKTTLEALQTMNADSPWITLFERESHTARAARFQISVAEQTIDAQLFVTTMAFNLNAKSKITQILFFKAKSNEATLRHYSGRIEIATDILDGVQEPLKTKLAGLADDYIKALPPLR
jgi:hypothetical protein